MHSVPLISPACCRERAGKPTAGGAGNRLLNQLAWMALYLGGHACRPFSPRHAGNIDTEPNHAN